MKFYQRIANWEELIIVYPEAEKLILLLLRLKIIKTLDDATEYLGHNDYQWDHDSDYDVMTDEMFGESLLDVEDDENNNKILFKTTPMSFEEFEKRMDKVMAHVSTTDPEVLKTIISWKSQLHELKRLIVQDKYELVRWPEVQFYMEQHWFKREASLYMSDEPCQDYFIPVYRIEQNRFNDLNIELS